MENLFRRFCAFGVGWIDIKDLAILVDGAVFDTRAGDIHEPEVLDAGGLCLIPTQNAADRSRPCSPTAIAQIQSAVWAGLIIPEQLGALEDVIVVFKGGGQMVPVKDGQPGFSARGRWGSLVKAIAWVKRNMIDGEVVREFPVGFQLAIEPRGLFGAVRDQMSRVEEVEDNVFPKFSREITSVVLLGKVPEIKNRIGGGGPKAMSVVVSNRQDHRDGEALGGDHALLPGIEPGVPTGVIRQPVVGVRDVAADGGKFWFVPGCLLEKGRQRRACDHVAADNEAERLMAVGNGLELALGGEAVWRVARDEIIACARLELGQLDPVNGAAIVESLDFVAGAGGTQTVVGGFFLSPVCGGIQ